MTRRFLSTRMCVYVCVLATQWQTNAINEFGSYNNHWSHASVPDDVSRTFVRSNCQFCTNEPRQQRQQLQLVNFLLNANDGCGGLKFVTISPNATIVVGKCTRLPTSILLDYSYITWSVTTIYVRGCVRVRVCKCDNLICICISLTLLERLNFSLNHFQV